MTAFLSLVRKNLRDSRWMLGTMLLSLFWLSWLFVHVAHRIEKSIREATGGGPGGMRMLRGLGGAAMDFSTGAIEMAFWNHPFILLIFSVWAISRGSGAIAGELERGTMDLVMSRPVSRTSFVASQLAVGLLGMVLMGLAMVLGNLAGTQYNTLESPPSVQSLSKPAFNLLAFGWAIYGYTLLLSSGDLVRWRPTMIASIATLAMFVALVVASIPSLEEWKWLGKLSIFKAYNPVEAITKGEFLAFNCGILATIGTVGVAIGYVIFLRRDLPAGS
ncbi:ABC transporter permease subunit [Tundrisphaera lichenicola]|uniref:ABC transporter permease subunit n=1 Tax=Tundrisphaera lichenicola TaxID=2029860 RepID=UPI003EC0EA70